MTLNYLKTIEFCGDSWFQSSVNCGNIQKEHKSWLLRKSDYCDLKVCNENTCLVKEVVHETGLNKFNQLRLQRH